MTRLERLISKMNEWFAPVETVAALDHTRALHEADSAGRQYCIWAGVR